MICREPTGSMSLSRLHGTRLQDFTGLRKTLENLPMTNFKAGDIVRLKHDNFDAAIGSPFNTAEPAEVVHAYITNSGPQMVRLKQGEMQTHFYGYRLQYDTPHAPAGVDPCMPNKVEPAAPSVVESTYLQSRASALRGYNASCFKIRRSPPHDPSFNAGFDAGALFGRNMQKAEAIIAGGLARNTDPANSHTSAPSPAQEGKLIDLVYADLKNNGKGTAHTVAQRIGHPLNAVSPRFAKLIKAQRVRVVGGERVGRGTRSVYDVAI